MHWLSSSRWSWLPCRRGKARRAGNGNSAYQNVPRLDNPRNDAALMAETLSALGFTLIGSRAQLDLDKTAMDLAVLALAGGSGADVALFYCAGTAFRSPLELPDSGHRRSHARGRVDLQMVDINLVLRQMQGSGTRLNVEILDACRNNPFGARSLRASDGGLAQMRAPEGTLISYATQPGNVALDGRRSQPLRPGAGIDHQTGRPRHLPDLQPGRPRRKTPDRRVATALGVVVADRRQLLFCSLLHPRRSRWRRPRCNSSPPRCARIPTASRSRPSCCANSAIVCSNSLRSGAAGQQERHAVAISKFQEKARMTPTGDAPKSC